MLRSREMARDQVVSATEFKAKCLAFLDDIEQTGARITVTRRGRAVAVLGPVSKSGWKNPAGSLAGKARILADIENIDNSDMWDVVNHSRMPSR